MRRKLAGILAVLALAASALVTAAPSSAATQYGGSHRAKSPICWAFNICREVRHCEWRKIVKIDPRPRWHCHIDRY